MSSFCLKKLRYTIAHMFGLEPLINVIAPHTCVMCGAESKLVCDWCLPDFVGMVPPRCYICYAVSPYGAVCSRCRSKSALKHVWVRTDYVGNAKQIIHSLKFERVKAAGATLAKLMSESLPYLNPQTILVPLPTANKRVRQRGYDQATLLARELGNILQLPHKRLLSRLGQSRQVGTTRRQRSAQLASAFRVTSKTLPGTHVVLVDDVLTTGATLESAAQVLKQSGAKQIDAVVFAQTLPF